MKKDSSNRRIPMTSLLTKISLAALVALGGLSASTSYSAAAEPSYAMGGTGGITYIQYRDNQWDRDPRRGWDRDRDRHHGRPGCSPGWAEEKAARMGLRHARVVDVSRRAVVVVGRGWRGGDRIVFANERGCPIIRR
jgi:hypothetical protein